MPDIDFQKIVLNLIPEKGDEPVVFYASQYETARPFIADLMWGETEFAPGVDCWAEIDIRKNDDNLVVITDDVSIDNNEVSVILPVQALTCIGNNLGQVKIYAADDQLIAALNFILEVQPDPLAGGVTSETVIDNLTQQIETITQEVIGEDYYDKSEVDTLLAAKADSNSVYTKGETDALLNDKANVSDLPDMTQYYTKSATDTLLDGKLNTYQMSNNLPIGDVIAAKVQQAYDSDIGFYDEVSNVALDVYTKSQIDVIIDGLLPVGTESGPIASFNTEMAVPLVNVSCNVLATGGNGTPENPIPIVGYTEANITANGDTVTVNFGQTVYGGVLDVTRGKLHVTHGYADLGSLSWNKFNTTSPHWRFRAFIDGIKRSESSTSIADIKCPIFSAGSSIDTWIGTTPYIIASANDADAVFVVDEDYSDADAFTTAMAGIICVYELATPFDIDLTPVQINAIVGTNNVYSDTNGDTTVQYRDSIQHYIDSRV